MTTPKQRKEARAHVKRIRDLIVKAHKRDVFRLTHAAGVWASIANGEKPYEHRAEADFCEENVGMWRPRKGQNRLSPGRPKES